MRKYNKALTALLSLLMMVVLSIGMASCTTIEVLMGLFQDSSIKNPGIGGGIFPSTHTCESVCPECGLCTDLTCEEDACADKCQGHEEVHECESECPECGKCLDMTCEEEACLVKCGDAENMQSYVFEAEDSHVTRKAGDRGDLPVLKQEEYGATETYVGNFNANAGSSMTFNIYVEEATTVTMYVSACKRPKPSIFTNNVAVLVNKVTMLDSPSPVPVTGTEHDTWTDFADVNLGCVELKAGKNEIKLAIMDAGAEAGYNINNISFKSALPLTWFEGAHECETICSDCGKCKNYECNEAVCADKCEEGWTSYEFSALAAEVITSNTQVDEENSALVLAGGANATAQFEIISAEKTYASLNITLKKGDVDVNVGDILTVNYNGNNFATAAVVSASAEGDFVTVKVGYVELKAGKNVVKISGPAEAEKSVSIKDVTFTNNNVELDWYKLPTSANYIFEAENAASNAWVVDQLWKMKEMVASGGVYVGHVGDVAGQGYYLMFSVWAEEACEAKLYLGLGTGSAINATCFPITVNDGEATTYAQEIPGTGWTNFTEFEIATIALVQGENTIKIEIGAGAITNIDYMGLACDKKLSEGAPVEIHACTSKCDTCGKCTDLECTEEVCADKCAGHENDETILYKFEAENAASNAWEVNELWKMDAGNASGGKYVGRINDVGGRGYYLSFTIVAEEACEATLYYGLGTGAEFNLNRLPITLNGVEVPVDVTVGNYGWTVFTKVEVTKLSLQKGENTLVITINSGAVTNMDYIALSSPVVLTEGAPVEIHKCTSQCATCGKCTDMDCTEAVCAEKCAGHEEPPVEPTENTYKFEAENAISNAWEVDQLWKMGNDNASGGKYVARIGDVGGQGYYLTFEVYAKEACEAKLYYSLGVGASFNASALALTVNGTAVATDKTLESCGWETFNEFEIATLSLVEGKNTITILINAGATTNMDYVALKTAGELSATAFETEEPEVPVEPTENTYKFEAENAISNAWEVDQLWKMGNDNASGGKYVARIGDVGGQGYYLTFEVYAKEACEAKLYYSLGVGASFNASALALTVNGTAVATDKTLESCGWETFNEFEIATLSLVEGKNTITILINAGATTNMDYVALKTAGELSATAFETEEPEVPVEPTENTYKFEAENAISNAWEVDQLWKMGKDTASGGKYVARIGDVGGQGYYLTFEVYAKEACEAKLYYSLGVGASFNVSALALTVNGNEVATDKTLESCGWETFNEFEIATLSLVKGKNTITILINAGATTNMDYVALKTAGELSATAFETEPVEPTVNTYKFEAENAISNAWEVDQLWKVGKDSASGGKFVGHINDVAGKGYYLTFEVYAKEACEVKLIYSLGTGADINASALALTVNGTAVTTDVALANCGWETFTEFEIATISLVEGKNTITIMFNAGATTNMDYIELESTTELSATEIAA